MRAVDVVYLHGVGGPTSGWEKYLPANVAQRVTLRYDDLLAGRGNATSSAEATEPSVHSLGSSQPPSQPSTRRAATERETARFERSQEKLGQLVDELAAAGDCSRTASVTLPPLIPGWLLLKSPALGMPHAATYRYDQTARADIYQRITSELQSHSRPIVLLAHSLGSVVAIDYLHQHSAEVSLLLTVGSPVGIDKGWCGQWEGGLEFPVSQVGSWLNVVNNRDPIPWNRPIAPRIPQAVDAFISAGRWPAGPGSAHDPGTYIGSALVREAISRAGQ